MTDVVYKYPMPIRDDVELALTEGAEVLSVINQREDLVLYARVDANAVVYKPHNFVVRGTGHPFQGNEGAFIGTASFADGSLIFHVFQRK